jgi:hypothetical protein
LCAIVNGVGHYLGTVISEFWLLSATQRYYLGPSNM